MQDDERSAGRNGTYSEPQGTSIWVSEDGRAFATKRVKTAYGYVNNHFAGHSPATIRMLQEGLGLPTVAPERIERMTMMLVPDGAEREL